MSCGWNTASAVQFHMLFQKAASAAAEKVEFRVDLAFTPAYMPLKIRVSFSP
jgi:hypothetical protein